MIRYITNMSGGIREKFVFVFLFLLFGVSLRWGFNHFSEQSPGRLNRSRVSDQPKAVGGPLIRFSEFCWNLEQSGLEKKRKESASGALVRTGATAFCFCMGDQIEKHKHLKIMSSFQEMKHNYFSFINTSQGKKIKDYCHQLAKYEIYRKTGRSIAAYRPPTQAQIKAKSRSQTQTQTQKKALAK
jgi:hypothetical protein